MILRDTSRAIPSTFLFYLDHHLEKLVIRKFQSIQILKFLLRLVAQYFAISNSVAKYCVLHFAKRADKLHHPLAMRISFIVLVVAAMNERVERHRQNRES